MHELESGLQFFLKVSLNVPVTDSVTVSAMFLEEHAIPVLLSTTGIHLVKAVFSVTAILGGLLERTVICQDSVSVSLTLED